MSGLIAALGRQPRGLLVLEGFLWIAILGVLDYFAPPDLSFLIFYVAPVLFLVWFVGRWAGLLGAFASAAFWTYEDVLSPHAYPSTGVADWNIAVRLVFLALFVWVVADLKRVLQREKQAEQERLERDVRIAQEVQARLFPRMAPQIPNLQCQGVCRPARGIAGDYYDFVTLDGGHAGIAVADVAGKGLPAALLMASLQAALRSLVSRANEAPAVLARDLNAQLCELTEPTRFATLFWGVFDERGRTLNYVNAGHNAPLLMRKAGAVDRLAAGGRPLGVFPDSEYRMDSVSLAAGDVLVVYTDGVTEAPDAEEREFGEERLLESVRANEDRPVDEICRGVLKAVDAYQAGLPQQDDMTLVVARVT
ncbi:MAG TPA: PP2C family protein-serine/threonine phosphatase [Thermoanaerobaculia bacterium]